MQPRRTQAERRRATIDKLLDATVVCLAEHGYAHTSVARVAAQAGVSQGALFNHFKSRVDVIVAAIERVSERHTELFAEAAKAAETWTGDRVPAVIRFVVETVRSPAHAAWHEVMVAARTDDALLDGVRAPLAAFEASLLRTTQQVFDVPDAAAEQVGAVVLSLMHMFDSEAVTVGIVPNPTLEALREKWAASVLRDALVAASTAR